ncbi:MAG: hypothetical protein DCC49_10445 [Acidobacteria bacterium]|nr:MAG: hypothetical protein DCC49_10445 [Acidobacteriota bacterium]
MSELGVKTSMRRRLLIALVGSAVIAVTLTALLAVGLFRLNANRQTEAELKKQASALGHELETRINRDALQGRQPRSPQSPSGPGGGQSQNPVGPGGGQSQNPSGPGSPQNPSRDDELPPLPMQVIKAAGRLDAATVWADGANGQWVLARSDGEKSFDPAFVNGIKLNSDGSGSGMYRGKGRTPMSFGAQRISTERGPYLVVIGRQVRIGDALIGGPRFIIGALLAIVISILIALWLSRRLDRPLNEMAAATGAMARGDFSHRVTVPREAVSHDLRTPLTAIRGYGEALSDGILPDRDAEQHAAEVIVSESARLERLVGDLLDLARLDAGEFALRFTSLDLAEVLNGMSEVWGPRIAEAGQQLKIEASEQVVLTTDGDRIVQIVGNLLENSMRHTPEGGEISILLEPASAGAWIQVADNGSGIPPDDLPHIFERLYVGRSADKSNVGTGLGLAIVSQLVGALGGTIDIQSAPDEGTKVNIWIPPHPPAGSVRASL